MNAEVGKPQFIERLQIHTKDKNEKTKSKTISYKLIDSYVSTAGK